MAASFGARAGIIALALVVLTGCNGEDAGPAPTGTSSPPDTPGPTDTAAASTIAADTAINVELAGGVIVGGPRLETARLGDEVVLRATSDVAEELHVHTYDVRADVAAGAPQELRFRATIPGRHEVEFEHSGKVALTLEVR